MEPGLQESRDRLAAARQLEASSHASVMHDDERRCDLNAEALDEVSVRTDVDPPDGERVVVAASLQTLRDESFDPARTPVGRVVEEQQLRPGLSLLDDAHSDIRLSVGPVLSRTTAQAPRRSTTS